jgi:RNA polymerase sigma-70 factor, ECF subfamily
VPALDAEDWNRLFVRCERMAFAVVRGITGDAELGRDVFQEAARATFERAQDGFEFASPEHARNYLFQAVRNLAIDARSRAPARFVQVPAESGAAAEPIDPAALPPLDLLLAREAAAARLQDVRAAFAALPPREREVLELRYLRGQKYKDIAAATGRAISTLQAQVDAGLRRLRDHIGKPVSEE